VAIKLAELGVAEVVTLLKADLAGKLTAIDAARTGDTLVLAAPADANYYDYPNPMIAGPAAHVEVFESDITFVNAYSDVAVPRAVYEIDLTVRLTYFNRDSDTPAEMAARGRRYAVGIFQVFSSKPTLGGVDDAIQVAITSLVSPQLVTDGEDSGSIEKGLVTVTLNLRCEEN